MAANRHPVARLSSLLSRAAAGILLLPLALAQNPALAQSLTGMVGKAVSADEQVTNAAQAAEEALKTKATKGEYTRGASGAIASLLTSSDELICSAWIISFRVRYRNMVIEGADPATLRAMENLMEAVEKACDKVLSPVKTTGTAAGGEAGEEPAEEEEKPIYPECPECDPLKRALDQRTYEYQKAQLELAKSMRWTDFVEAAHKSGKPKGEIEKATGGETPETAERSESRKRADVSNAQRKMEEARAKLVECLEKCNASNRKKYAFLGKNPTTYALAGGVALGAGLLLTAGGDDEPTNGTTPPPGSSTPGNAACAGTYNVAFNVARDPRGHRNYVQMPPNRQLTVSLSSIHITGQAPFVPVNGDIDAGGSFVATGVGTVAGYANVSVRMAGRFSGCTSSAGTLTAEYTMGANGELPGGEAITYNANGTK